MENNEFKLHKIDIEIRSLNVDLALKMPGFDESVEIQKNLKALEDMGIVDTDDDNIL